MYSSNFPNFDKIAELMSQKHCSLLDFVKAPNAAKSISYHQKKVIQFVRENIDELIDCSLNITSSLDTHTEHLYKLILTEFTEKNPKEIIENKHFMFLLDEITSFILEGKTIYSFVPEPKKNQENENGQVENSEENTETDGFEDSDSYEIQMQIKIPEKSFENEEEFQNEIENEDEQIETNIPQEPVELLNNSSTIPECTLICIAEVFHSIIKSQYDDSIYPFILRPKFFLSLLHFIHYNSVFEVLKLISILTSRSAIYYFEKANISELILKYIQETSNPRLFLILANIISTSSSTSKVTMNVMKEEYLRYLFDFPFKMQEELLNQEQNNEKNNKLTNEEKRQAITYCFKLLFTLFLQIEYADSDSSSDSQSSSSYSSNYSSDENDSDSDSDSIVSLRRRIRIATRKHLGKGYKTNKEKEKEEQKNRFNPQKLFEESIDKIVNYITDQNNKMFNSDKGAAVQLLSRILPLNSEKLPQFTRLLDYLYKETLNNPTETMIHNSFLSIFEIYESNSTYLLDFDTRMNVKETIGDLFSHKREKLANYWIQLYKVSESYIRLQNSSEKSDEDSSSDDSESSDITEFQFSIDDNQQNHQQNTNKTTTTNSEDQQNKEDENEKTQTISKNKTVKIEIPDLHHSTTTNQSQSTETKEKEQEQEEEQQQSKQENETNDQTQNEPKKKEQLKIDVNFHQNEDEDELNQNRDSDILSMSSQSSSPTKETNSSASSSASSTPTGKNTFIFGNNEEDDDNSSNSSQAELLSNDQDVLGSEDSCPDSAGSPISDGLANLLDYNPNYNLMNNLPNPEFLNNNTFNNNTNSLTDEQIQQQQQELDDFSLGLDDDSLKSLSIDSESVGAHQLPQSYISSSQTEESTPISSLPTFGIPPPIPVVPSPLAKQGETTNQNSNSNSNSAIRMPQSASSDMLKNMQNNGLTSTQFTVDFKNDNPPQNLPTENISNNNNESDPWKNYVNTQYKYMSTLISANSYGGDIPGFSDEDLFGFSSDDDDDEDF